MKKCLLALSLCVLSAVAVSCSSANNLAEQPNYLAKVTAYLPYVESVQLPSHAIAYRQFEIGFELSAQLQPSLLNGYAMVSHLSVFNGRSAQQGGPDFIISTWAPLPAIPLEPVPNPILKMAGLPPGSYKISITTASSAELGGIGFVVQVPDIDMDRFYPSYMPDDPAVSSIELELVVHSE